MNDKSLIFKLGIELIVILIIIALLTIDIKKFKSKAKEEMAEKNRPITNQRFMKLQTQPATIKEDASTKVEENKKI